MNLIVLMRRRVSITFGEVLGVGAGSAVVVWAIGRGAAIRRNPDVKLEAAPLVGRWDWAPTARILPAVFVGAVALVLTTATARRFSARVVLAAVGMLSALWTVSLAWSQGTTVMIDPVVHPTEYWSQLPRLPPAARLLRVWADPLWMRNQPVHIKGHPPGYVFLLKAMGHVGLSSKWAVAALSWVCAGGVAVAVVAAVRLLAPCSSVRASAQASARSSAPAPALDTKAAVGGVASEQADAWRVVAPFAVVAPYAVWMGTSADTVFSLAGAGGVVAVLAALRARRPTGTVIAGAGGGLLLGLALFLSYGMVTFLAVPAMAVLFLRGPTVRRRMLVALSLGAGIVIVFTAFALAHFWWFAGLKTTREFYWKGTAQFRPWAYFFVSNIAVVVIATGPAIVAGAGRLVTRHRRRSGQIWLLALGAVIAIMAANISQLSKGETERIWLPFFTFLIPLAVVGEPSVGRQRFWLAIQISLTVVLQIGLMSKW